MILGRFLLIGWLKFLLRSLVDAAMKRYDILQKELKGSMDRGKCGESRIWQSPLRDS